jgi:hypothetical protein
VKDKSEDKGTGRKDPTREGREISSNKIDTIEKRDR